MEPEKEESKSNIFPTSKRIKVQNTSSLFDLKAELLKRKQEANASKVVPDFAGKKGGSKWKEIAADLEAKGKDKELKRFLNRKEDEKPQVDIELERSLLLSRQALERKTKLYEEKMQKALQEIVDDDSDDDEDNDSKKNEDERDLVNFDEKALFAHKMRALEVKLKPNVSREEEHLIPDVIEDDDDDNGDWVEFTDSLGRTRKCLKTDLEYYKRLDIAPNRTEQSREEMKPIPFVRATSESEDDKSKDGSEATPITQAAPLHYQNVRNEEVRELGVGYFQFSKEDEERKQQMKMLNHLRDQTIKQRELRQKLKDKKKVALEERLEKIAKKRGIEYKRKAEAVEESSTSATDIINRLISDAKHESIVAKKTEKVRQWDSGKVNDDGMRLRASSDSE